LDDWRNWMDKKETRKIQGKIDSLLGEKTFFDVYLPEEFRKSLIIDKWRNIR
jgi:hypothetical protein